MSVAENGPDGPDLAPTPSSPSSASKVHRTPRRRNRPHNGPPGFQFIIAQDPSDFKNETTKRSVRSQAMIQYRYKSRTASGKVAKKTVKAKQPSPPTEPKEPRESRQKALPVVGVLPITIESLLVTPAPASPTGSSSSTPWGPPVTTSNVVADSQPTSVALTLAMPHRYHHARSQLSTMPMSSTAKIVNAQQGRAQGHEASFLLLLRACAYRFATVALSRSNPYEPFAVLPTFKHPELNARRGNLIQECVRAFVSDATMHKWFPAMTSHEHILLSAITLVSTWTDMHNGIAGDSCATILVKSEIIGWINARLGNTAQQFDDATLMVILHLLAGELWSCNERALRIHEKGVAQLILHRGGLDQIGGSTAEVSAACCMHTDIVCEAKMLPLFQNWDPPQLPPVISAIPESPLLCPHAELFTLAADKDCSAFTYDLLCDMRDLTDLFIAHEMGVDAVPGMHEGLALHALYPQQYHAKMRGIQTRLVSLPSAYAPDLPTSNDWIYESCRIAAIIYASSIIMRAPLSFVAQPGNAILLADLPYSATLTRSGRPLESMHLSKNLYETLLLSDTASVPPWGALAGVLYWVSLVGAAAARTSTSLNTSISSPTQSAPRPVELNPATWVRRCLVMYATRTMIILIFLHPLPIILTQRKMLLVQELIERDFDEDMPR